MKHNRFALALLGLLSSSSLAAPAVDTLKTPTNIAAETGRAYIRVAEPLSIQCAYNVVYIDTSGSTGKSKLAVLLSARAMGRRLSVLAYTQDAAGLCWASTLEME